MAARTILVGVDFSHPSGRALDEARIIARRLGASVELLHVASSTTNGGWRPTPEETAWMDDRRLDAGGLRVRHGTPWVELSREGAERAPMLIVVGSHGRGGYQTLSLGLTASRLTLASSRPVLVVGQRATLEEAPKAPASTDVHGTRSTRSPDPADSGNHATPKE